MTDRGADLERIRHALERAVAALQAVSPEAMNVERKASGGLVTAADHAVNETLRTLLPRDGEGWLSEESADDAERLGHRRVWVVDPLDGTEEFVAGIPEWCISVGLVEDGEPVAGGICNPAVGQLFLGAVGSGVTLNGNPVRPTSCTTLDTAEVLASRSEVRRGEWAELSTAIAVKATGSVAYKMALVAAGLADATWTLVPKHEWDVAAGAALVRAGGGTVRTLSWEEPRFNRKVPKLTGLIAAGPGLESAVRGFLADRSLLEVVRR